MKKKVILIPGNTDLNRGDQALVWESINLINDIYDNPDIFLMKGDDYRQYSQTEKLGYRFIDNILRHPGRIVNNSHINYSVLDIVLVGFRSIIDLFTTLLLLVRSKVLNRFGLCFLPSEFRKTYKVFSDCDAIFVKGGGFIHSYGSIIDPYQMYYLLFNILLGIRFKKSIVVLPNSVGPFKNKIAAWLADYTLNRCRYVSVRESISEKFMLDRKSVKVPVYRHADLGYYLKSSNMDSMAYLKRIGVNISLPKVAITLRPYRFPGSENPIALYNKYIESFAKFAVYLASKSYQVVLCAHTLGPGAHENDSLAIAKVAQIMNDNKVPFFNICDESLTCQDMMAIYASFDYLIGTRFHSVIFAQNSFVPTIAISYGGNKGKGIMSDLSLSEYSIPMDIVDYEKLVYSFEQLVDNRVHVLKMMEMNRERVIRDRRELVSEIRDSMLC